MYLTATAKQFRLTTYQKSSKLLFEALPKLVPRAHFVTRCNNDYTLFYTSYEAKTRDLFHYYDGSTTQLSQNVAIVLTIRTNSSN